MKLILPTRLEKTKRHCRLLGRTRQPPARRKHEKVRSESDGERQQQVQFFFKKKKMIRVTSSLRELVKTEQRTAQGNRHRKSTNLTTVTYHKQSEDTTNKIRFLHEQISSKYKQHKHVCEAMIRYLMQLDIRDETQSRARARPASTDQTILKAAPKSPSTEEHPRITSVIWMMNTMYGHITQQHPRRRQGQIQHLDNPTGTASTSIKPLATVHPPGIACEGRTSPKAWRTKFAGSPSKTSRTRAGTHDRHQKARVHRGGRSNTAEAIGPRLKQQ